MKAKVPIHCLKTQMCTVYREKQKFPILSEQLTDSLWWLNNTLQNMCKIVTSNRERCYSSIPAAAFDYRFDWGRMILTTSWEACAGYCPSDAPCSGSPQRIIRSAYLILTQVLCEMPFMMHFIQAWDWYWDWAPLGLRTKAAVTSSTP